jgi:heat shock protein HtpX
VKVIDLDTNDPALSSLVQRVHELARKADLPLPQVGIYQSDDVNAFATGPTRSRSLVAVSTGLLSRMGSREIDGVLAHEITHIANGDMVTLTLVQGVINAFVMFFARIAAFALTQAMRSQDDDDRRGSPFFQYILVFVFEMIFSLLGFLVVSKFSRWREFRADAGGAQLAGKYEMIGALRSLQRLHGEPDSSESSAFQAFKISGKSGGLMGLFATHPPLAERIQRLENLA